MHSIRTGKSERRPRRRKRGERSRRDAWIKSPLTSPRRPAITKPAVPKLADAERPTQGLVRKRLAAVGPATASGEADRRRDHAAGCDGGKTARDRASLPNLDTSAGQRRRKLASLRGCKVNLA